MTALFSVFFFMRMWRRVLYAVALLPLFSSFAEAGDRRYGGLERLIPPDTYSSDDLFETKRRKNKSDDALSRIEVLMQNGNDSIKRHNYAQAKLVFEKALALFDQVERLEPKCYCDNLIDKAECLDSYAQVLEKLNRKTESKRIRALALGVRKKIDVLRTTSARSYSKGYPPYDGSHNNRK